MRMQRSVGLQTSCGSAERPAIPCQLKIASIRDVQRWLAEAPIVSCCSVEVQRIREAVAVLSRPNPRKEDVQPLQGNWKVSQKKKDRTPRPLPDVLDEFKGKVIKATQKLQQQLLDSAARPVSSTTEQFSLMEEMRRTQSASSSAALPISMAGMCSELAWVYATFAFRGSPLSSGV